MNRSSVSFACGLLAVGLSASAQETKHRIVFAEYGGAANRLVELDEAGRPVWEYKLPSLSVIFQVLPNGNIVFAYGGKPTGVMEIDRAKKTVFNHVSKCPQVLGCERLANGNTLVAEQGPCQVVEVTPEGKVAATVKLTTAETGFHRQVRAVHKLENGNLLAAHEGDGAVREVDPTGKVVWEYKGIENVHDALRLAGGNTLIACGTQKRLIEVTPEGRVVWEFGPKDAPELNLTWICSLQVLKNGNYVVANFLRGQEGKGVHAFEVTRDKKVVWTFADHKLAKSITTVRVIDDPK